MSCFERARAMVGNSLNTKVEWLSAELRGTETHDIVEMYGIDAFEVTFGKSPPNVVSNSCN